jgi:chromate transporter
VSETKPTSLPLSTWKRPFRQIRYLIFLKDVAIIALTAFGGPQVHTMLFLDRLVRRRGYLTEDELLELTALCQVLPGPTSTQTITAVGFRIGGPNLAYLTLLIWIMPSVLLMTAFAGLLSYLQDRQVSLHFTRFLGPMAVGFIFHGGWVLGKKVIHNRKEIALMIASALLAYFWPSPWACPVALIICGGITAREYHRLPEEPKDPVRIEWSNFILWLGVLVGSAVAGGLTRWLPLRLFENFYRNGSLVFGGGQVLGPMLFTEFVSFKKYLTEQEFLSGLALAQTVPGPNFSLAAFVGSLSLKGEGFGGELIGAAMATLGIFLPGTFLIFFAYRFWEQMKKYRGIRASLVGINAANIGITIAAGLRLFVPLSADWQLVTGITVLLLLWGRIPPYILIPAGILTGLLA